IQQEVRADVKRERSGCENARIWEAVPRMVRVNDVFELYKNFYEWMGRPELFKMAPGNMLEFSDVFPLIYCKIRMEGVPSYEHVKHLLIDEMQDYTPVQYSVISRLFKCKKTILGDVTQTVNPYSGSSADVINQVFPQADVIKLVRSYRSTLEIIEFAQKIQPNPELIPLERHGPAPELKGFNSNSEEIAEIARLI